MNDSTRCDGVAVTMARLARDGWCVALKTMPDHELWLLPGSRSEYDAPGAPKDRCMEARWVAEAAWVGRPDDTLPWIRGQVLMGDDESDLIQRLAVACDQALAAARHREQHL